MTLPALTVRQWAIAAVAGAGCVLGGFAAGRSTKPAEVREVVKVETRTEWKDRVVERVVFRERKDRQRHVESTTEKRPDGTEITRRTEDTRSQSDGTGTRESDRAQQGAGSEVGTSSRIVRDRASWRASLSADWGGLQLRPEFYGGSIERRIAGPVWLGVRGRTDWSVGVSIGIEF